MATAPSAFLHSSAFPLTEELSLTPQPEGGPGAPLLEDLSTDLVTTHEGSLLLAASATPYGEIAAAVRAAFAWPCSSADPATCPLWVEIRGEAQRMAQQEPLMGSFLFSTILNHHCLIDALAYYLAQLLSDQTIGAMQLHQVLAHVFKDLDPGSRIRLAMREDLLAIRSKDAACRNLCEGEACMCGHTAPIFRQSAQGARRQWPAATVRSPMPIAGDGGCPAVPDACVPAPQRSCTTRASWAYSRTGWRTRFGTTAGWSW